MGALFVSYSREDKAFVERLHGALVEAGQEVWLDFEEIPVGADWRGAIERGIKGADAFAFVLSPDSVASEICMIELHYAVLQRKRIVSLLRRVPEGLVVPAELAERPWILMREGDDFEAACRSLASALRSS